MTVVVIVIAVTFALHVAMFRYVNRFALCQRISRGYHIRSDKDDAEGDKQSTADEHQEQDRSEKSS